MADGIQITAGSGTNISTDDRTEGHIQEIVDVGAGNLATGQAAPTNSAANIVAARARRKSVTFINVGSIDVYIGPATVTTSNGVKLIPGAALTMETVVAVQGITASGTGAIHYWEEYNA